ncbi:MAG: T9SS C-terminal target domain-containing protein, partial [Chitinophagia bacterium]|nr:T9SS C-terminal target domain-containing protein [Chitinophagia bacterium]
SGGTWASSDTSVAYVNATTGAITAVSSGVFTISYTITGGAGCTSVATVRDTVISASAGSLSSIRTTICTRDTFMLSSSVSGGVWTSGDTAIATVVGGVVTGRAAGTTNITYTVTNSRGCTAIATVGITINARPATPVISGATSLCIGTSATLTADVTGGTWASSVASVAAIDTAGLLTASAAGVTTISYTITSSLGCSATATRTDTVWGAASTPVITAPARICAGGITTLSASVSGGTWSTAASAIASVVSSTGLLIAGTPGTVAISYTIGSSGCAATATTSIVVDSLPATPAISGAATICAGSITTYTGTPAGGSWSVTDTALARISGAGVLTARAAGTEYLVYTNANAAGCTARDTMAISILAAPTAAITPATGAVICHGAPVTLSITPATFASYQWYRNGVAIAGATSVTYSADTVGTYTAIISNGSCSATLAGVTVTNSSRPTITRSGSILSTGVFATYQWYRNGTIIAGANSRTFNFTLNGSYIVVTTTASGCRDTSLAFTVNTTGIQQVSADQISLYPNPATSVIRIDAPFLVNVAIFSADGRKVMEAYETNTIDVSSLASGMY